MTRTSAIVPTILLSAATGARSLTGIAATARHLAVKPPRHRLAQPARFLAAPHVSSGIAALAAMELAADKLPFIPNRTDPGPLLGRIAGGALIGAALAAVSGRDRAAGAIVGAVAAFAGAHLGFQLRRELAEWLPATAAGMVEDAAVGAVVAAGISAID